MLERELKEKRFISLLIKQVSRFDMTLTQYSLDHFGYFDLNSHCKILLDEFRGEFHGEPIVDLSDVMHEL
jgi:hypothetical protein